MLEGQLTKQAERLQVVAKWIVVVASLPAAAGACLMFYIASFATGLRGGLFATCLSTGLVILATMLAGVWYFLFHVPARFIRSFTLTDDELVVTTRRGEEVRHLLDRLQTVKMSRTNHGAIVGYWIGFETGWLWLSNMTTSARPLIDDLERILKNRR